MVILNLPYPPSVNAYWLTSGKRKYISKRGREFKDAVANQVIEYRCPKLGDMKIQVTINLGPRNKKLMDIDNCCKAVLDSLQDAGVFNDDSQVWKLTVERDAPFPPKGYCHVIIEPYED